MAETVGEMIQEAGQGYAEGVLVGVNAGLAASGSDVRVSETLAEAEAQIEQAVDEALDAVQAVADAVGDDASEDREFIADLTAKRHQLREAEADWAEADREQKRLKKRVENIAEELVAMIDEFENRKNNPQLSLPFGKPAKPSKPAEPAEEDTLDAAIRRAEEASIVATKAIRMDDKAIKLTEKVAESLGSKGAVTVGDFCNLEAKYANFPGWMQELPGIGQAKADKIRDAVQDLFTARAAEAKAKARAEWEERQKAVEVADPDAELVALSAEEMGEIEAVEVDETAVLVGEFAPPED